MVFENAYNSDVSLTSGYSYFASVYVYRYNGGGAYFYNSEAINSNCTFRNNTSYYGGGAYFIRSTSSLTYTFNDCVFEGNTARYGGGIYCYAYYCTASFSGCTFSQNTANYYGAGYFYGYNGNLSVDQSVFEENTANYYSVGYYYTYNGKLSFTNSHVIGNTSTYSFATAFYHSGGTYTVANCNFSNNEGAYLIYLYTYGASGSMSNCNLVGNTSTNYAFYSYYSTVQNTVFYDNTVGSGSVAYLYSMNSASTNNAGPGGLTSFPNSGTNVDTDSYSAGDLFSDYGDWDGDDDVYSTSDDGLVLTGSSPLKGAGTSSGAPTTDITNTSRTNPPAIGAYSGNLTGSSNPCNSDQTKPEISTRSNITVNVESGKCGAGVDFSKMVVLYNPTGYHNVATPFGAASVSTGYSAGNFSMHGWPTTYNYEVQPVGAVSTSSTIQTGEYVQFDITFPIGTLMSHITYSKRSYFDDGARKASIRSSVDGYSSDIDQISCNPSGDEELRFDLSGMAAVSGNVVFRIYFWDATGFDYMDLVSTNSSGTGMRVYVKDILSASDNCELSSFVLSGVSSSDFYGVGTHTIEGVATDANNNSASQSFTITVIDNEAPTVTCGASVNVSNDAGKCGAQLSISPPTVVENCNLQGTALNFDGSNDYVKCRAGVVPTTGEYTVMVWARQLNNHSGTFREIFAQGRYLYLGQSSTGIIRVGDAWGNTGVTFPTDNKWHHYAVVRKTNNTLLYIDGTLAASKGSSIPSPVAINYGSGIWPNDLLIGSQWAAGHEIFDGDVDEMQIWNTALDEASIDCYMNQILSGGEQGLVAYYNFEDGEGSTVLTDAVSASNDGALTNMDENTDWVNSPVPSGNVAVYNDFTHSCDASGFYPVGTTTITWTATDQSGNSATCTQTVVVNDTENPTISGCPSNINVSNDAGDCGAKVTWTAPAATDNCSVTLTSNSNPGDFFPVGTSTVTYTAEDASGNKTSCSFDVTVNDTELPTVVTQNPTITLSGGSASISAADVNNGSSDNCGIESISVQPSSFDCSTLGAQTVTLTVKDIHGNVNTGTATVTVNGSTPTCSISSAPNSSGTVIGSLTTYAATDQMFLGYGAQSMIITCTASNGGPFTYSWTGSGLSSSTIANPVFTPSNPGNYTLTCTVTNSNGCETTCSIVICVMDARGAGGSASNPKVTICHVPAGKKTNPQTLSIGVSAVAAHLGNHGGCTLGACGSSCDDNSSYKDEREADFYYMQIGAEDLDLVVYPNPSSTHFTFILESPLRSEVSYRITDLSGRLLESNNGLSANNENQFGKNLPDGMYLVTVEQGGYTKTFKVIKAN